MNPQNRSVKGLDSRSETHDDSNTEIEIGQRKGDYLQYRAPSEHGNATISPPLRESNRLLVENRLTLSEQTSFQSLRDSARSHLIKTAIGFTRQYRDIDTVSDASSPPIIMSGHQPTLFHPGVWFKNFALSKIAKNNDAIPINLVIDNDVAIGSTIRVPLFDASNNQVSYQSIDFDQAGGGVPYEQLSLADPSRFDSFPSRVSECIRPLVATPCVNKLWMHASFARQRSENIGTIFAEARHSLETQCDLETLEVPLSKLCETAAFAEFALIILDELHYFHRCYNASVQDYRLAHKIRSASHPVPNLRTSEDWLEAPFWIYGNDDPKRRPAWVKRSGAKLSISDGGSRERSMTLTDPCKSAESLLAITDPQFKIRPRAILTTMYARTILSDLFLHGIGGGKYDQLGDRIFQSFFQINPAKFVVISATATLPYSKQHRSVGNLHTIQRSIRDTIYQPETFTDEIDLPVEIIEQKRALLRQIPEKGHRKQWHSEIERLNEQLASYLASKQSELRASLQQHRSETNTERILANREYSFCLFNLNYLNQTFATILSEAETNGA
jgi:hypothetical protein